MKTILILVITILLYACNQTGNEKSVSIIDYRNPTGGEPAIVNPGSHKDKDVEFFRINGSESYSTVMYRLENGKLNAYESDINSNAGYDKAAYTWINDSTLRFKLVNSSTRFSVIYSMIGNKGGTRFEKN